MDLTLLPRNIWLVILAATTAFLLALFQLRKFNIKVRPWPVRLYLYWLSNHVQWIHGVRTDSFKDYVNKRKNLLYREQLLISWFIWFVILITVLLVLFGCGGRGNAC